MPDLLLELFSEEIPARMQEEAATHLKKTLVAELSKAGYAASLNNCRGFGEYALSDFVTPRRLAVILRDLPAAQADVNAELKGPRLGAPEAALQGFLKKCRLPKEKLIEQDGVYIARIHQKGRPTADILKEIIEKMLAEFPWPKSMRWGDGSAVWVRPLHSILCIFDGHVVPVEFAGLKAGNVTYGHRFLSPKAIAVKKADEYEKALKKAHVIVERDARRAEILQQAERVASAKGCLIQPDTALLDEVTGLVEWPVALVGNIDKEFMDLPPEVLSTVMKKHQKYFSLLGKDGKLAPYFLMVANMESKDGGKAIISGNERVLRARFSDARFFWDQDRKKKLDDWTAGLKDVTFHAKLGTVADKVSRIKKLAVELSKYMDPGLRRDDIERAVMLCKADLTTGMVGEFAELQGVMGRYYALFQSENPEVADAIGNHYKPQGPGDSVPRAPVSICVALADKLDTLISMFAIGEKPTGSKDPFALRRAALGIIRIILENNIRLPLLPLLDEAPMRDIALHKAHDKLVKKTQAAVTEARRVGKYLTVHESASEDIPEGAAENVAHSLLSFFHDRLIVQLKDSGIRHDVIKAVVANGDDDLVRIVNRARAVQAFLDTDDGKNLLAGYKRAANIVSIEEKKDKAAYQAAGLNAEILKEKEEKDLAALLDRKAGEIKSALDKENFEQAMKLLSALRQPVDLFFDKVMVNCEDRDLRANRLRLLASIKNSMDSIALFALLEGDAKEQKRAA